MPKEIAVTVWYQGKQVAFTPFVDAGVVLYSVDEEGNFVGSLESDAGIITFSETGDKQLFIGDDSNGVRIANIAAMLVDSEVAPRFGTINIYYEDEATFDFDNATSGNRALAWLREIENARSTDNKLYRVTDPSKPITIDYTFALDMTAIEMPAQLEPLKSMLPDGTNPDAAAWDFLLSLAERICVQTNVTIRAEFSPELDVDISGLKVITDYFELTSANLDENNVLTLVCNWKDQTQSINPATANPLCLLAGITATVKDTASYFNNEVVITNNGTVTYDIYLATSALHSFASDPENQAKYGLYPFEHSDDKYPNGCRVGDHDTGGHFSSQYLDFADIYVVNTEIRQGWQEEDGDYYFYKNNSPVTGTQLVTDRHDANKLRFYEFDEDGKLVDEQGANGLVWLGEDLYYAVLGEAQTGWQQIDGNNYYFHPDTGKAVDGIVTIRESVYPGTNWTTVSEYTYTFTNHILTRGEFYYDYAWGKDVGYHWGTRYRWAGNWMKACWFEVDGDTYYVGKNEPYFITTGYAHYIKNYPNEDDLRSYLFDENGVLQKNYSGPADVLVNGVEKTLFFKNGERYDDLGGKRSPYGLHQGSDGYYYCISTWEGEIVKGASEHVNANRVHGLAPAGTYTFDAYGRMTNDLLAGKTTITNNTIATEDAEKAVTSVMGRVLSVVYEVACKVVYKDAAGKYHVVEAMVNPYAASPMSARAATPTEYNFAIPEDATEVKVMVSGDVSGDGKIDKSDVQNAIEAFKGSTTLSDEQMYLADVDGDGKITAADIAYINAVVNKGIKLDW